MSQDNDMHARVQAAIALGWIPDRRPDHLWGGRASRGHCAACRVPMKLGEVVLEVQFVDEGGACTTTHDVHVRCYVALEDEWDRRESGQFLQHSTAPAANTIRQG